MSKHRLQLGLQARLKLRTLGSPVHFQFTVRRISGQLLEFGRIVPHTHVSLLQLRELYLLLPLEVSGKLFLEKLSLEGVPSDILLFRLHLSPSILPPGFDFLHQHIGSIIYLLGINTTHCSEYLLQVLDPLICHIQSESALELIWITPTELSSPRYSTGL
ncbi:hypothetical protein Lalb_Chr03g0038831 [Lupinus albus]|uniref:Uncharacterized protein n=1 Tax=Lupinus albus TaxID=3870 RepID=A0A6A4QSK3_LUPAL|nr:hypothetical protein Lalb_Chr03g0038831 [Lupinus albus]